MSEETKAEKQVIMPTHRDLLDSKRFGWPILTDSKHAVFVRKLSKKKMHEAMKKENIATDKALIEQLCSEHKKEFIVDFQYANKTVLTDKHLAYFEELQQVPALKFFSMVERSSGQSAVDFEQQIIGIKKRNSGKTIVIVTEPSTVELLEKIAIAKTHGIEHWAVIFRGFKKYNTDFKRILATLKTMKLFSFVIGVFPKKMRGTNASMLLPALRYGANAVAAWIPWGGGPTDLTLLCEDWTFKGVQEATSGLTDYNGQNRLQIVKVNKMQDNVVFERIDTINQTTKLVAELYKLTEERFVSLFK